MGNHQFAIKDFEQARALEEDYSVTHFHLGVSKLKSKRVREAIEDFNNSIRLEENAASYDGLGQCYHMKRDYKEALDNFQKAIQLKENNSEFLKNRA